MMQLTMILFFILCTSSFFGQTDGSLNAVNNTDSYKVTLNSSTRKSVEHVYHPVAGSRIIYNDSIEQFLSLVDSIDSKAKGIDGFRVQLFSNSGPGARKACYEKQADFIQQYPNVVSYTLWVSPNWVLRIGDYRSQLQARQFLDEIKFSYPAAFVVSDKVKSEFAR